ncbi:hypothetical protein D3C71_2133940 [compost metagenome]
MIARATQLAGVQSAGQTYAEQSLAAVVDRQEVPVWALRDFSSVVREGIVLGGGASQLLPHGLLTRAESAALLRRVLIKAELINS